MEISRSEFRTQYIEAIREVDKEFLKDNNPNSSWVRELLFYNLLIPDTYTEIYVKRSYTEEEHNMNLIDSVSKLLNLTTEDSILLQNDLKSIAQIFQAFNIHLLYLSQTGNYPTRLTGGSVEYYDNLLFCIKHVKENFADELTKNRVVSIDRLLQKIREDLKNNILSKFYQYKSSTSDLLEDRRIVGLPYSEYYRIYTLCVETGISHIKSKRLMNTEYIPLTPLHILENTNHDGRTIVDALSGDGSIQTSILDFTDFVQYSDPLVDSLNDYFISLGQRKINLKLLAIPHLGVPEIIEIMQENKHEFEKYLKPIDALEIKQPVVELNNWGIIRMWLKKHGFKVLFGIFTSQLVLTLVQSLI